MAHSRWISMTALVVSLGLGWTACPGAGPSQLQLEPDSPASRELQDIKTRIQPYDLTGRTLDGLERLDEWIRDNHRKNASLGLVLRAETHVDLWVFGQLAIGIDDAAAAAALEIVARRVGRADAFDRGPDPRSLSLVGQRLAASVESDLADSGADDATVQRMVDLVELRPWDPGAIRQLRQWHESPLPSPRIRLLLAAVLTQRPGPWSGTSIREMDSRDVNELSWLCSREPVSDLSELATRCGFWCAELSRQIDLPVARAPQDLDEWIEDEIAEDGGTDEVDPGAHEPERPISETSFWGPGVEDGPQTDAETGAQASAGGWDPTPGDTGYELVRACGAEYFGLPATSGVVLLDPIIHVDLVLLSFFGDLMSRLQQDLTSAEPLIVLSSNVVREIEQRSLSQAVPSTLTPAAFEYDPRLELPRIPPPVAPDDGQPTAEELTGWILTVRSDGVYLASKPYLRLSGDDGAYRVIYAESDLGYHYPGRLVLDFVSLNRLEAEQVESDQVPLLAQALADLEACQMPWLQEETLPGTDGDTTSTPQPARSISMLVDASTYTGTLVPIVRTLLLNGYRPVFHVLAEAGDGLGTIPLAFELDDGRSGLRLRLTEGRFELWTANAEGIEERSPFSVGPLRDAPFLTLYRELVARMETGALDTDEGLRVELRDEQIDFGILSHLYQSLAYRREAGDVDSDAELLGAPVPLDGNTVQALLGTGLVFIL